MKKTLKSITSIVMVVAICLCAFTACSGGNTGIVGTWKLSKAEMLGFEIDVINGKAEDYADLGVDSQFEMLKSMKFEFRADGTCTASGTGAGSGTSKYELKGSELYVDDQNIGTYTENQIVIEQSGVTMTFIK